MIKRNIILLTIFLTIVGCGTKKENKESVMDKEIAVISTKFGDIKLEFFDEIAPKHVESFKLHAQNGYYDGTIFHRVIPGFMIQGGDPLSKSEDKSRHGTGGNAAKYLALVMKILNLHGIYLQSLVLLLMKEAYCQWLGHKILIVAVVSFLFVLLMQDSLIINTQFLVR